MTYWSRLLWRMNSEFRAKAQILEHKQTALDLPYTIKLQYTNCNCTKAKYNMHIQYDNKQ